MINQIRNSTLRYSIISIAIFLVFCVVWAYSILVTTANKAIDYRNFMESKIGETVIVKDDTLTVVDYTGNSFILNNGTKVHYLWFKSDEDETL